ncbi:MAG: hypothetical protein PSX36_00150 [bacterium]|nr:hypothetical protein [bacterium]
MPKKILPLILLFLVTATHAQRDSARVRSDSTWANFAIPLFNTAGEEAETQVEQQDVSPLLQSSRDIFMQFSSFQFGAARYKLRGYSSRNQSVYINGITVNNPETGMAGYSNWGGLNDVTRYTETRFGTVSNPFGLSGTGGYVNIESRSSTFKKGTRASYSSTNRIYRNRLMITHSTGLTTKGWALTASTSLRSGNEVQIQGTYFRAAAWYLSVDKLLGKKHLLSFTGFGAPLAQGRAGAATMEVFDLASTNYYNSNWGKQSGDVRNATVSRNARPTVMLSDVFTPDQNSRLSTSVYYYFGKSGSTGLNWNDAPNPKPDYYRYLPSYFYAQGDTGGGDLIKGEWQVDEGLRQINWNQLIAMNQANLYTDPHLLGQGLNTSDTRARYILENKVENVKNLGINTVYNKRWKKFFISAGLNANIYKNRKYKIMEDLLGASFWIDVDQFAENLGVEESIQQNDLDHPNRKVRQGEKFGYDFSININKAELWAQTEYNLERLDCYVGLSFSGAEIWREGYVANGKFPTTSKGESKRVDFLNGGLKAGLTYKLNGRHFITVNVLALSRNPDLSTIFISQRVRNDLVKDVHNEEVFSGDLSYHIKYPYLKLRVTYFNTQVNDQTWLRSYWHDSYNTTVNLIMRGVNQNFQGIECGIDKIIKASHVLQGAIGCAQSIYTNRPTLEAWQDNNNVALFQDRVTYLKNYRIGGSPQLVTGVGYKFSGKKFWFAGIYGNYFDQIYVEPNPDRRTQEAAGKYQQNEVELAQALVAQERLPSYFVVNANAGKSFRVYRKYFLNANFSINNLLNSTHSRSTGFESLRWDQTDINKFPNKYYYMNGISYMLILNCSF